MRGGSGYAGMRWRKLRRCSGRRGQSGLDMEIGRGLDGGHRSGEDEADVRARGGCGTRGLGAVLTWDSCLAVSPIVTSFSWANLLYMVVAHHLSVVRGCYTLDGEMSDSFKILSCLVLKVRQVKLDVAE